eukprot:scaffold216005_cov30-Tisochrysis_lutea.AAC.1
MPAAAALSPRMRRREGHDVRRRARVHGAVRKVKVGSNLTPCGAKRPQRSGACAPTQTTDSITRISSRPSRLPASADELSYLSMAGMTGDFLCGQIARIACIPINTCPPREKLSYDTSITHPSCPMGGGHPRAASNIRICPRVQQESSNARVIGVVEVVRVACHKTQGGLAAGAGLKALGHTYIAYSLINVHARIGN